MLLKKLLYLPEKIKTKKDSCPRVMPRSGKHKNMSQHQSDTTPLESLPEAERSQKVQALREMVQSAEKTIQSAKAMLLQLEGKKKSGRPRKIDASSEGTIIEGPFDGQVMIGTDGKQYPVPANYASKSKLVEGDMLKLTITNDGMFLYKQIGPVERRNALGIMTQDENGNYYVITNGKPYRVLLASVTYFKALPGDEVAVVLPRDIESNWAAIENVIERGSHKNWQSDLHKATEANEAMNAWKADFQEKPREREALAFADETQPIEPIDPSVLDAWVRDMEKVEQEIRAAEAAAGTQSSSSVEKI